MRAGAGAIAIADEYVRSDDRVRARSHAGVHGRAHAYRRGGRRQAEYDFEFGHGCARRTASDASDARGVADDDAREVGAGAVAEAVGDAHV